MIRTVVPPLLALAALSGCKSEHWEVAFDATESGAQSGVWGSGADDVYVVGGTPEQGTITHYDGTDWTPVALPEVPLLVWVFGFGPDDIWSVGEGGGVLHFDGTAWTRIDVGTTEDLWGVWGSSPTDLWMVGGDVNNGDPLLIHHDGSTFETVPLDPTQNDRNARSVFKVFGTDGRVFAVGQLGLMIEWDGSAWKQLPAGADADQDFVSLWGSGTDDLVAVGGRSGARVATFTGDGWETTAHSGVPGLNAVSVNDAGTWVGGQGGFVGRWTAEEGIEQEESAEATPFDLHAMWHDGEGMLYGVGGQFREPYEGVAWQRRTR